MRVALLTTVLALACSGVASAADTFSVVFSGAGESRLVDVQRWILLDENECYLRDAVDQTATLSWTLAWRVPAGKAGSLVGAPVMGGTVAGTDVGDLCGEELTEPDLVPENWIHADTCSETLTGTPGPVTARVRAGNLILTASGPRFDLPAGAVCSLKPRSTELQARVVISLKKLRPGKAVRIPVGSGVAAWGTYTPHLNCMHTAKPYDGYRSTDECGDDLTWSGTLLVTRSR